MKRTVYYVDTEFLDTGKEIELVSIGIVCEDGRTYYAQSTEFDEDKASEWVNEHVLKLLPPCPCCGHQVNHVDQPTGTCRSQYCMWRNREYIKRDILAFMDSEQYGTPELRGWITSYDYVAFAQLFGTMLDVPAGFPHYIADLQMLLDAQGITDDMLPPQEEGQHHALEDARHVKRLWELVKAR